MEKRIPKSEIHKGDPNLFTRCINNSPLMPFLEKAGYRTHLKLLTVGQFNMITEYLYNGKLPK